MSKPASASKKIKLTGTQAKIVKAKMKAELENKSITELAPEIYPNATPDSARTMVHRELQNVTVQEALAEAMARAGLTVDTLSTVVKDAAQAKRVVQIEGDFYETEVPDHSIRLKAVGMAARWMGADKNNDEGGTTNLNFFGISGNDGNSYKLG